MKGRTFSTLYRGRHRADDGGVTVECLRRRYPDWCDFPTKPIQAIDTPVRRNIAPDVEEVFVVQHGGQEIHTWVFEGAAVPPYVGTHIAMHCNVCNHVAWTYRNTDQGWAELLRRINEHKQVHS